MILFRVFIENKKIVEKMYWRQSEEDADYYHLKDQFTAIFPDEIFPYEDFTHIGVNLEKNVMTVSNCCPDNDSALKKRLETDLFLSKDFIRYIYDFDNKTKTYEMFYRDNQAYPIQPLGQGLSIYRISDMVDADYQLMGKQSVYVKGSNADVFTWANTLNPSIEMPISVNRVLNKDDSYQFQFDTVTKKLESVKLFARPERTMVWNKEGTDTYIEYTADYTHDLINPEDAELVIPKYDLHGNRVASDTVIEDIKEYILVPKPGFDGEFKKVKLSEI
jgi:hypothetical protein